MLTQGAFNALLKTLEEPPKHVIFVLATTEDAELAVTSAFILSRSETKAPFVFVEVVAMATACVSAEDWAWKHKRETRIKDLKIRL